MTSLWPRWLWLNETESPCVWISTGWESTVITNGPARRDTGIVTVVEATVQTGPAEVNLNSSLFSSITRS